MKKVLFRGEDFSIKIANYHSGDNRKAIQLIDSEGEVYMTATSNFPDIEIENDEVFIKTYSGNEGILECLIKNNVIEYTGKALRTEHVDFPICKLLITE